MPSIIQ